MADQQQLDNQQRFNELLQETLFLQRDYAEAAKEAAKKVFDNNFQVAETYRSFKNLAQVTKDVSIVYDDILKGEKSFQNIQKDIVKRELVKKSFLIEQQQALTKIINGKVKEKEVQNLINQASQGHAGISDVLLQLGRDLNDEERTLFDLYVEQNKILEEQNKEYEDIKKRAKLINKEFGILGNATEGIDKILKKSGFSNLSEKLGLSDAVKKTREFTANITKGGTVPAKTVDKFKIAGNLAKNVGGNLLKSLGPIPLIVTLIVKGIQFLVKSMFAASQQVAEFQRNLGLSYEQANQMRDSFYDISKQAGNLANVQEGNIILQKDLIETQKIFNESLGIATDLSTKQNKEFVAQLTNINKFYKLSQSEVKGLNTLYVEGNQEIDEIKDNIFGTVGALALENKEAIDIKKVFKEILTTNSSIKLASKGNVEELATAVFQAQRLGLSLNDVMSKTSGILDFESSIASELQTELLIGKNINLEKLRYARLTRDSAGITKELNKIIETMPESIFKNQIALDSFAQTIGLSADELADAKIQLDTLKKFQKDLGLLSNEKNKKLTEELYLQGKLTKASYDRIMSDKATTADYYAFAKAQGQDLSEIISNELTTRFEAQSAQEKFNDVLNQAKETFASFVNSGVLDKFVNIISSIVNHLSSGGSIFGIGEAIRNQGLKDEITNVLEENNNDYDKTMSQLYQKRQENWDMLRNNSLSREERVKIREEHQRNRQLIKYLEDNPSITSNEQPAEDFIIRPGQPIQKFRKDDVVIGGTNLGGDNTKTLALLERLVNAVERGGTVTLDGQKVGEALVLSSYKIQ